jgi:hypothetical protein
MSITKKQEAWVRRHDKKGVKSDILIKLIEDRKGKCAWSDIPMKFDKESCKPSSKAISATVEHNTPGTVKDGYKIVCHYLNDIKGRMPYYLFEALRETSEWKKAMARMRKQAKITPNNMKKIVESFENE